MIKIKNSQLNNDTIEAINSLIDQDINAGIAFKLTRVIKELSSAVEDKVKIEKRILDKYVEKDADGNPVMPKDESGNTIENSVKITNVDEFSREMNDLLNQEIEIGHTKIKFEDLNLKTAKVKDLLKIEFLFEDVE